VDGVRDDVRAYVVEHLGDKDGVLIADDTGFLKKGTRSAGVQRQYSGTAGRTENCQIGVFLCYVSRLGRVLIDRELYLPASWTDDRDRCRAAYVPDEVGFATKPAQAKVMLERVLAAGMPFRWFTADEAYGQNPGLRSWLEEHDVWYVMATREPVRRPGVVHRRHHGQRGADRGTLRGALVDRALQRHQQAADGRRAGPKPPSESSRTHRAVRDAGAVIGHRLVRPARLPPRRRGAAPARRAMVRSQDRTVVPRHAHQATQDPDRREVFHGSPRSRGP
jgi:hypothetical protein